MKLKKFSNLFLLGAALAMMATGCKHGPQGVTYLPEPAKKPIVADNVFHDDVKTNANPAFNPNPGRNPTGPGTLDSGPRINPGDTTNIKPLPDPGTSVVPTPPATNAGPVDLSSLTPPNEIGHPGWTEDATILIADTVYFDFDKSTIRSSEQSKLTAVADYLRSNPLVAVRVEGNCDERGTEGYNLSLGERRALAGREYLIKLGIDAARVDTITYGESRPADPGHNEAAWAKNRRDDFIILTAPKP